MDRNPGTDGSKPETRAGPGLVSADDRGRAGGQRTGEENEPGRPDPPDAPDLTVIPPPD
jgi:hypothetical protein